MRTDEQIIEETNELARYLLAELIGTGYQAPEDHKFYESDDPRSKTAWAHAVRIMEMTTKTEMADAIEAVVGAEDEEPVLRTYGVRLWATLRGEYEYTVDATSYEEAIAKAKKADNFYINYKVDSVDGDQTAMVYGPSDDDPEDEDVWGGDGVEIDMREAGEPFSWDACQIVKELAALGDIKNDTFTSGKGAELIARAKEACSKTDRE